MDLTKLFETQKVLDERIVEEKGLEGRNLFEKKKLSLLTELGELANEWRGFKFWSEDREPRTVLFRWEDAFGKTCESTNDPNQLVENFPGNNLRQVNPLLEEYVDCLHFIFSIGNEINIEPRKPIKLISFSNDIVGQFNSVFQLISSWSQVELIINEERYHTTLNNFLHLGEMLGFTWEQIETAYYEKNKVNHERQASNY